MLLLGRPALPGVIHLGSHAPPQVTRLERSRRYMLKTTRPLTEAEKLAFAALVHDRMTEEVRGRAAAHAGSPDACAFVDCSG